MGFIVADDKITEILAIADPKRVRRVAAAVLPGSRPDCPHRAGGQRAVRVTQQTG
jgi:hypothetical protein